MITRSVTRSFAKNADPNLPTQAPIDVAMQNFGKKNMPKKQLKNCLLMLKVLLVDWQLPKAHVRKARSNYSHAHTLLHCLASSH